MAVTSYEVGAIFTIVSRASPVLAKIAEQLGAIDKQIAGLSTGATNMTAGIALAFGKVTESAATALGSMRALKTEMAEIAASSQAVGRLGAPIGIRSRGTGGGGGGGAHFTGPGVGLPGGSHMRLAGNAAMAGVGMLGYGAYLEAQMQDAIFQLLYHTGQADTPENREKFSRIIQDAMASTGSSLSAVADAAKQEVRMFKGTPGGGVDVLPEMLRAAATEARVKGTSLDELMTSLIGYAHMLKDYTPDEVKKVVPALAFLSASNPASLAGMERASSYAVPILRSGMEIDPIQSLLLGTALTRAGATNTKSGTWPRNMALNAMPGTSLMSKIAFKKHEEALAALGLVDSNDNPTWFTDSKPDLIKMLTIAGDKASSIPLSKRAAYEKQLFGTQGFGGFALLADPAVKQQIATLMKDMNSSEFKNRYASFMEDYSAGSPVQASRQSWADLQNVLMDLGSTVLPGVTRGLKGVDEVLTGIQALFGSAGAFQRMNDDQKVALRGITDGLDIFIGRLKGIAGAISGLFGGGGPGVPAPASGSVRNLVCGAGLAITL